MNADIACIHLLTPFFDFFRVFSCLSWLRNIFLCSFVCFVVKKRISFAALWLCARNGFIGSAQECPECQSCLKTEKRYAQLVSNVSGIGCSAVRAGLWTEVLARSGSTTPESFCTRVSPATARSRMLFVKLKSVMLNRSLMSTDGSIPQSRDEPDSQM